MKTWLFALCFATLAGSAAADRLTDDLVRVAEQANKQLPKTLDADTVLDHVTAGPGRRLTYHYKLTRMSTGSMNSTRFNEKFHSDFVKGMCAQRDRAQLFKVGLVAVAMVDDMDGASVAKLAVTGKDCGW